MLDVADMSAREVDNDEVVCIDGLLRRDKDIRCNVWWSEEWKTTRDDDDGANDSIITTPIMKKIHNTPRVEEDIIMIMTQRKGMRVCVIQTRAKGHSFSISTYICI